MLRTCFGVKGLVTIEDKFLVLVKPNGDLDLPGGRVEAGESMTECLYREIKEETDLNVEIMEPFSVWSFKKNPGLLVKGKTYHCNWIGGKVQISHEHMRYFWSPFGNNESSFETICSEMIYIKKGGDHEV